LEGGAMTPNELLVWLSARKLGSWPQFRGAVETLDLANATDEEEQDTSLPLHQRVRFNLERLGHVEFDAAECEDGWHVVPPVLALSPHGNKVTGVLCGARTPKLMERVERAADELSFECASDTDCPDIIRMHAPDAERLMELARREGLLCQSDAPTALLSRLPPVGTIKGWRHEPLPAGGKDWDVRQFIIERKVMKWRTITLREANMPDAQGLFCFTRFQMPQYFLREGRETIKLPGAIGKYRILSYRQRRVLRYDRQERRLTLPAILRPPLLTERGLILCSGFPPALSLVHGRRMLTYRDIPEEVAGMTAEVLRQDLL
jgi:hypothetical protein